ncbi:hypothetical protein K474DRAFT_1576559, partial [Panus rudis PR-1116 ss-1]
LLYIAQDRLTDRDLPHRTTLRKLVIKMADEYFNRMVQCLATSLGRLHFTADVWSNSRLRGFMAVTVHY